MRELKIAFANTCKAKYWTNTTMSWEALCGKLKQTIRTKETVREYKAMGKAERDSAKDHGGFVGGYLKDGRRSKDKVQCRSLLSLDGDNAEPGFIEEFAQGCGYAAVLYTTHSHTPEEPRVRILIPLEEDVTPDCYVAVARYFAAEWGIGRFDPCSYKVNQLMYWPTTPSDGEYICRVIDGPFLNAARFLEKYPDWRDCSKLPASDKEKQACMDMMLRTAYLRSMRKGLDGYDGFFHKP